MTYRTSVLVLLATFVAGAVIALSVSTFLQIKPESVCYPVNHGEVDGVRLAESHGWSVKYFNGIWYMNSNPVVYAAQNQPAFLCGIEQGGKPYG